jgi:hypothetical protein
VGVADGIRGADGRGSVGKDGKLDEVWLATGGGLMDEGSAVGEV